MGISETSLLNAHFQRLILTLCAALVMKNNSAIHVERHRLLYVDRLHDFEQVYVLLRPIWPWYPSQPAICPVLYSCNLNSPVMMWC